MTDCQLIHGDSLDELRSLPGAYVDLVYLDPPFNSGAIWNGDAGSFDDRWLSMDAYIDFMRDRITEIRRVLKPTGSFYLHADDSAHHYLKVMCDTIFGSTHWLGQIIWRRIQGAHSASRKYGRIHDTIHVYVKGSTWTFNIKDQGFGVDDGELWLNSNLPTKERVGYPTQKPVALLERIISVSSNLGDLVLDPMCGSGTTLVAARNLGRRSIGIDSSADAIAAAQQRLDVPARPLQEALL